MRIETEGFHNTILIPETRQKIKLPLYYFSTLEKILNPTQWAIAIERDTHHTLSKRGEKILLELMAKEPQLVSKY